MFRQSYTSQQNERGVEELRLLHGLPSECEQALNRWLDALGELPMDAWLAAGESCADHADEEIRQRLESVVHEENLQLVAWFIRDMVATAAHAASAGAWRLPRSSQRRFSAARRAADWAALGIAMQSWLTEADGKALCAPFDRVIARGGPRLVQAS